MDNENKECIEFLKKAFEVQFVDEQVGEDEMQEFVTRKIKQLLQSGKTFLPNSFKDANCPGLDVKNGLDESPFDFLLDDSCKNTLFSQSNVGKSVEARHYHLSKEMLTFGEELKLLVKEHCLNNTIPASRLKRKSENAEMIMLQQTLKLAEWLLFWGERSYAFRIKYTF